MEGASPKRNSFANVRHHVQATEQAHARVPGKEEHVRSRPPRRAAAAAKRRRSVSDTTSLSSSSSSSFSLESSVSSSPSPQRNRGRQQRVTGGGTGVRRTAHVPRMAHTQPHHASERRSTTAAEADEETVQQLPWDEEDVDSWPPAPKLSTAWDRAHPGRPWVASNRRPLRQQKANAKDRVRPADNPFRDVPPTQPVGPWISHEDDTEPSDECDDARQHMWHERGMLRSKYGNSPYHHAWRAAGASLARAGPDPTLDEFKRMREREDGHVMGRTVALAAEEDLSGSSGNQGGDGPLDSGPAAGDTPLRGADASEARFFADDDDASSNLSSLLITNDAYKLLDPSLLPEGYQPRAGSGSGGGHESNAASVAQRQKQRRRRRRERRRAALAALAYDHRPPPPVPQEVAYVCTAAMEREREREQRLEPGAWKHRRRPRGPLSPPAVSTQYEPSSSRHNSVAHSTRSDRQYRDSAAHSGYSSQRSTRHDSIARSAYSSQRSPRHESIARSAYSSQRSTRHDSIARSAYSSQRSTRHDLSAPSSHRSPRHISGVLLPSDSGSKHYGWPALESAEVQSSPSASSSSTPPAASQGPPSPGLHARSPPDSTHPSSLSASAADLTAKEESYQRVDHDQRSQDTTASNSEPVTASSAAKVRGKSSSTAPQPSPTRSSVASSLGSPRVAPPADSPTPERGVLVDHASHSPMASPPTSQSSSMARVPEVKERQPSTDPVQELSNMMLGASLSLDYALGGRDDSSQDSNSSVDSDDSSHSAQGKLDPKQQGGPSSTASPRPSSEARSRAHTGDSDLGVSSPATHDRFLGAVASMQGCAVSSVRRTESGSLLSASRYLAPRPSAILTAATADTWSPSMDSTHSTLGTSGVMGGGPLVRTSAAGSSNRSRKPSRLGGFLNRLKARRHKGALISGPTPAQATVPAAAHKLRRRHVSVGLIQRSSPSVQQLSIGYSVGRLYVLGAFAEDDVEGLDPRNLMQQLRYTQDLPADIAHVSASTNVMVVVTATGEVYAAGAAAVPSFCLGRSPEQERLAHVGVDQPYTHETHWDPVKRTVGRLAIRHAFSRHSFEKVVIRQGASSAVQCVATGAYHTVAITRHLQPLGWGANARLPPLDKPWPKEPWEPNGQLGGSSVSWCLPSALQGLNDLTVYQVACGEAHTAVLTDVGLFTVGSNEDGQLGRDGNPGVFGVVMLGDQLNVVSMACGTAHMLALTDAATVWGWGSNVRAQVGTGVASQEPIRRPTCVFASQRVHSVAAGMFHSAIITEDRRTVCWGSNDSGQVGVGPQSKLVPRPTPVVLPDVLCLNVTCGSRSTVVVSAAGDVYWWGMNLAKNGVHHQYLPQLLSAVHRRNLFITRVAVGELNYGFLADELLSKQLRALAKYCAFASSVKFPIMKQDLVAIERHLNAMQNRSHRWLNEESGGSAPWLACDTATLTFRPTQSNLTPKAARTAHADVGYISVYNASSQKVSVTLAMPNSERYQSPHFSWESRWMQAARKSSKAADTQRLIMEPGQRERIVVQWLCHTPPLDTTKSLFFVEACQLRGDVTVAHDGDSSSSAGATNGTSTTTTEHAPIRMRHFVLCTVLPRDDGGDGGSGTSFTDKTASGTFSAVSLSGSTGMSSLWGTSTLQTISGSMSMHTSGSMRNPFAGISAMGTIARGGSLRVASSAASDISAAQRQHLVESLATYVPKMIVNRFQRQPEPLTQREKTRFPAAILFVDVSGFTSLNERLAKLGPEGPEQVSRHLNSYFGQLIQVVLEHGGDVLKFAGDALICMFGGPNEGSPLVDTTIRALQCGIDIQTHLPTYDSGEGFVLSLHIGISAGDLYAVHVGGVGGAWEFLVMGDPFRQLKTAVDNSNSGEVCVSAECWELIRDRCAGEPREADFLVTAVQPQFRLELPQRDGEESKAGRQGPRFEAAPSVHDLWERSSGDNGVASLDNSAEAKSLGRATAPSAVAAAPSMRSERGRRALASVSEDATVGGGGHQMQMFAADDMDDLEKILFLGSRHVTAADVYGVVTDGTRKSTRNGSSWRKGGRMSRRGRSTRGRRSKPSVYSVGRNTGRSMAKPASLGPIGGGAFATTDSASGGGGGGARDAPRGLRHLMGQLSATQVASHLNLAVESALRCYIQPAVQTRLDSFQMGWLAELRQVTVLFVKLGGLSFDADATDLDLGPIDATLRFMQSVVFRYEGMVRQFLVDDKGTVLIAAFGVPPYSHEDDQLRGLLAAVEIHTQLAGAMRMDNSVGVTTGKVFCGSVGSPVRQEYAMVGDTVNLSARLMVTAGKQGSGVLCDATTAEGIPSSRVTLQPLPPVMVKGKSAPIPIYRPTLIDAELQLLRGGGEAHPAERVALADIGAEMSPPPELKSQHSMRRDSQDSASESVSSASSLLNRGHMRALVWKPERAERARIVGRAYERKEIDTALEALVRSRKGATMVLRGLPGIGKTTLANYAMATAELAKVPFVVGRGDAIESETPFFVFRSVLRQLLSHGVSSKGLRTLVDFVRSEIGERWVPYAPLLADVLLLRLHGSAGAASAAAGDHQDALYKHGVDSAVGSLGSGSVLQAADLGVSETLVTEHLTAEQRRKHTGNLLRALLQQRASVEPFMLVLEGMQWVDPWSLDVAMALSQATMPVFMLVTSRPTARATLNLELQFRNGGDRDLFFQLGTMSPDELAQVVCIRMQVNELPEAVRDVVAAKADGNPMFAMAICDYLAEHRLTRVSDAGECLVTGDLSSFVDLPEAVDKSITSRIDRLDPGPQMVLKVASVLGKEFDVTMLKQVYPIPEDVGRVDVHLLLLERLDFVNQRGQGRYRFKHAMVREVTYSRILFRQRRRLHEEVGTLLASRRSDEVKKQCEVVYHLRAALQGQSNPQVALLQRTLGCMCRLARCEERGADAAEWYTQCLLMLGAPTCPEWDSKEEVRSMIKAKRTALVKDLMRQDPTGANLKPSQRMERREF